MRAGAAPRSFPSLPSQAGGRPNPTRPQSPSRTRCAPAPARGLWGTGFPSRSPRAGREEAGGPGRGGGCGPGSRTGAEWGAQRGPQAGSEPCPGPCPCRQRWSPDTCRVPLSGEPPALQCHDPGRAPPALCTVVGLLLGAVGGEPCMDPRACGVTRSSRLGGGRRGGWGLDSDQEAPRGAEVLSLKAQVPSGVPALPGPHPAGSGSAVALSSPAPTLALLHRAFCSPRRPPEPQNQGQRQGPTGAPKGVQGLGPFLWGRGLLASRADGEKGPVLGPQSRDEGGSGQQSQT